jgi:hypothetical protein
LPSADEPKDPSSHVPRGDYALLAVLAVLIVVIFGFTAYAYFQVR